MSIRAESAIRSHARSENFPVALRILSRDQRRHLLAIYDFARCADQIGDAWDGDRLAALDALERELVGAAGDAGTCDGSPANDVVGALLPTIRACALPLEPFRRLVEANRVDQRVTRYATWRELLGYCELSANPVGELVLRVFGAAFEPRRAASDAVCSGLQVTEHLQDLGEDFAAGRIYLPAEDLEKFGVRPEELGEPSASRALRRLVRFEAERARALLGRGDALAASLRGRARLAVSGFAAGGRAALDAIERGRFDTLSRDARPRRRDWLRHLAALELGARRERAA